jgi:flagellar basal-body rod modification protein FlgD
MANAVQNSSLPPPPVMSLNPGTHTAAKGPQASKAADAGKDKPSAAKNAADAQDRFLKLLVTQMKNQDPLNPMDNAEVTSQMAQLSTVSGIDKLNTTLEALSNSMLASQSMQASSMIGHVVLAPGNRLELKNGKAAAALELKQPADNVTVQIRDGSGNVVQSMNMGGQPSGIVQIDWDGQNDNNTRMPDGNYTFSASAQLGGEKANADTLSYGMVNGITKGEGGSRLKVEQLGTVDMNSVKQIM